MDDDNHSIIQSFKFLKVVSTIDSILLKNYLSKTKSKEACVRLRPVIPEVRRLRQEDHCKFEASLVYIAQGLPKL